ncbi:MAG: DUF4389 domain-containing protein [Nocardioides sp.]|nr:DUF4389 domain-containing protein [Nocardioides sp.]
MTRSTYPVRVDAVLDAPLNRGLWLVKWLAAIPHFIVLMFLWLSFAVLSVVALFAILFTGRYPRTIFDFNVGVLRWSWRVAFYAYGALGTDRYPPFTLHDDPDYPARLAIDYPEHLSRGLALVKWWLLAIPHYLVVGIFLSGGIWVANEAADGAPWIWGGGLIGLLVLIAAVALLFTGRYPRDVFDLVLGLNRWVLRVAAYAGLMTDQYPPFRFDLGGQDPGSADLMVRETHPRAGAEAPPPAPAEERPPPRSWSAGRTVTVVTGSVLLVMSLGFITAGIAAAVADQGMRDDDGFVTSGSETFSTDTYAVATESLEVHVATGVDWLPQGLFGDVRVTATAPAGSEVFVGVGSTAQVEDYLADVPHVVLTAMRDDDPVYRDVTGTGEATAPTGQVDPDLWAAQASGPGEQVLTWAPEGGDWTLVLMNPTGAADVAADVTVGAELPALGAAMVVLLAIGGTLLVIAVALLVGGLLAGRRTRATHANQAAR